jgi:hypothetical protein
MDTVSRFFGQDEESKKKAADDLVLAKEKELADAKTAAAALEAPLSGTVDGVKGGRRKKTRRGGKKSKKSRRSRK